MNRQGIRFKITAVASAAVAAVLVLGGFALVLHQRSALTASLDQALIQRSDDIVSLIEDLSFLPDEFAGSNREGFAQLVGIDGEVLVSTPNLDGAPALPIVTTPGQSDTLQTVRGLAVDDDVFRVLSRPVAGIGTLHAGTSYDIISESATVLISGLALTIPALVLTLGVLVWGLVGRTLRPVEDIRSEVAEIESTDLQRRVLRPGTGDEIDRLAATMNEMLERLEISIGRQRQFVADASHELRNPLTRMRSELEVDLVNFPDPQVGAVLQGVLGEVVGLQHMVEDLLHLAKADASQGKGVFEGLDLDDLVIREARRIRSHERVDVDLSRVSGAHVVGDAEQLTRAIRNILDNAERYAKGRISLSLGESDGMAVLTIADDGPGIPREQTDRVFERFGRLDEARGASTGGAGLGLAITRDIIERHRGSIGLITNASPGATFELRIPLADQPGHTG